jgi:hypothetical protein
MRIDISTSAAALALTLGLGLGAAQAAPALYPDPEAAVSAVVAALEAGDPDALLVVFGPEYEDLVFTGDAEDDRETWTEFLRDYRSVHRLVVEGGRAVLYTGRDQWPFPAEIVAGADGWSFDGAGAREEIELRRIGQNELDVIDLMRGYVRAQAAYRAVDYDGDGLLTFAAGVLSDLGERNGLYWPDEPGAPESPIGDFMARAAADGYAVDGADVEPEPYLGYYFRVLQRQGEAAPGGALDYMVGGQMLAGHALLAFPAAYGETGIMSFLVGEAGLVYQADLGEETLEVAGAIESFNPDENWEPVGDE